MWLGFRWNDEMEYKEHTLEHKRLSQVEKSAAANHAFFDSHNMHITKFDRTDRNW